MKIFISIVLCVITLFLLNDFALAVERAKSGITPGCDATAYLRERRFIL